jgi:hypothetical protein
MMAATAAANAFFFICFLILKIILISPHLGFTVVQMEAVAFGDMVKSHQAGFDLPTLDLPGKYVTGKADKILETLRGLRIAAVIMAVEKEADMVVDHIVQCILTCGDQAGESSAEKQISVAERVSAETVAAGLVDECGGAWSVPRSEQDLDRAASEFELLAVPEVPYPAFVVREQ